MFMFYTNKINSCIIHQKLFVQFYLCIPITVWQVVKQHHQRNNLVCNYTLKKIFVIFANH